MKKVKIKKVKIVSFGLLVGFFWAHFALLATIIDLIFRTSVLSKKRLPIVSELALDFRHPIVEIVLVPIIYFAVGFILGCLQARIYNLMGKYLGGLEVFAEESE